MMKSSDTQPATSSDFETDLTTTLAACGFKKVEIQLGTEFAYSSNPYNHFAKNPFGSSLYYFPKAFISIFCYDRNNEMYNLYFRTGGHQPKTMRCFAHTPDKWLVVADDKAHDIATRFERYIDSLGVAHLVGALHLDYSSQVKSEAAYRMLAVHDALASYIEQVKPQDNQAKATILRP